jgi:hypothetical protein
VARKAGSPDEEFIAIGTEPRSRTHDFRRKATEISLSKVEAVPSLPNIDQRQSSGSLPYGA